jgi:hypothetical protein
MAGRGPSLFKPKTFAKIVRAAQATGLPISAVEVHRDGRIVIVHTPIAGPGDNDLLDREEFEPKEAAALTSPGLAAS